jgi:site-specific recombinase
VQLLNSFNKTIDKFLDLVDPRPARPDLSYILAEAHNQQSLEDKIYWLESLIGWIRSGAKAQLPSEFNLNSGHIQAVRIRFILHLLERQPQWKSATAQNLRDIVQQASGLHLFCLAGISQESGFFSEAADRMLKKILPAPPRHHDLSELFLRVFDEESDAVWIGQLPPETITHVENLFAFGINAGENVFSKLQSSMFEALLILGSKIAALGLSEEVRLRLPEIQVNEMSFFILRKKIDTLVSTRDHLLFIDCQDSIEKCRKNVQGVFNHLEGSGVSTQIVYRLESLTSSLNRVEILLRLLSTSTDLVSTRDVLIPRFLSELTRDNLSNRNVFDLAQSNLHLLARKIVERSGKTGEHYIAKDRQEYQYILKSAAGGGLLTCGTTLIKFVILRMKLALFFDAFFHWINYASSFVAMQFLGFTLATKQPSMTAASLAEKLKNVKDPNEIEEFVDEVALITRSQTAAAIGNIGAVIPSAILFDVAFTAVFGHHVLNQDLAHHYVEYLNPFTTLTILHGAITGLALWLSSIAGGWLENWMVFRQIPEALAKHRRLNFVFGAERCNRFSKWFLKNISGLGVNISLGFFLAFTPSVGHIFGIPLEAKHVTLSTTAFTFALCSLWSGHLDPKTISLSILGLVIVGLLNFGVSFALSLYVAVRAREIDDSLTRRLGRAVRGRFFRRPSEFLISK